MEVRGRGVRLGLVFVVLAACGDEVPGPVSRAAETVTPPTVQVDAGYPLVSNVMPAETLNVYSEVEPYAATLLFLDGRAATPTGEGGSAWADLQGGRVIRFDSRGRVAAVLGGAAASGGALTQPAFVSMDGEDVLATEFDGRALRFVDDAPTMWETARTGWAAVGGGGLAAASRTVFDIDVRPLPADAPLIKTWAGGIERRVGRITLPGQAMLAPLVNSGWVATSSVGDVYFASAVRAEVHRYDAEGVLRWVSTWPHRGESEPTFGVTGGTLTPRFRLTQQAIAVGPDERVYVLATTGSEGPADRLLVFDAGGALVRATAVHGADAIYVGEGGHVFSTPADRALVRTTRPTHTFQEYELPRLGGGEAVSSKDHEGRVVVVNFWASWCGPCRREMPLLGEMMGGYSPEDVVVVGLNEDVNPDDALDFLADIGGVPYPLAEGRGELREVYGYRGLPYTVVLGRNGEVVHAMYGFGTSIQPIRDAVAKALAGAH